MKLILFAFLGLIILGGCATNISPNTYSVGSVGQVNRTIGATVISAREVQVSGTNELGGSAGAAAGAVGGSAIGNNGRENVIGAIAGAVAGGLAGSAIEQNGTKQQGIEYVVETENGNYMTIVQGPNPRFSVGQKIFVLYGSPSRLIADPRANH